MISFILITGGLSYLVYKFMNPSKIKKILLIFLISLSSFIPILYTIAFISGVIVGLYHRIF